MYVRPFSYRLGALALAAGLLGGAVAPPAQATEHEAGTPQKAKAEV